MTASTPMQLERFAARALGLLHSETSLLSRNPGASERDYISKLTTLRACRKQTRCSDSRPEIAGLDLSV